jgi:hypothetical protein
MESCEYHNINMNSLQYISFKKLIKSNDGTKFKNINPYIPKLIPYINTYLKTHGSSDNLIQSINITSDLFNTWINSKYTETMMLDEIILYNLISIITFRVGLFFDPNDIRSLMSLHNTANIYTMLSDLIKVEKKIKDITTGRLNNYLSFNVDYKYDDKSVYMTIDNKDTYIDISIYMNTLTNLNENIKLKLEILSILSSVIPQKYMKIIQFKNEDDVVDFKEPIGSVTQYSVIGRFKTFKTKYDMVFYLNFIKQFIKTMILMYCSIYVDEY